MVRTGSAAGERMLKRTRCTHLQCGVEKAQRQRDLPHLCLLGAPLQHLLRELRW